MISIYIYKYLIFLYTSYTWGLISPKKCSHRIWICVEMEWTFSDRGPQSTVSPETSHFGHRGSSETSNLGFQKGFQLLNPEFAKVFTRMQALFFAASFFRNSVSVFFRKTAGTSWIPIVASELGCRLSVLGFVSVWESQGL